MSEELEKEVANTAGLEAFKRAADKSLKDIENLPTDPRSLYTEASRHITESNLKSEIIDYQKQVIENLKRQVK